MTATINSTRLPIPGISWFARAMLCLFLAGLADVASGQSSSRGSGAVSNGPAFVLLGTTRIGDRYSAMLRHRDGGQVVVVSENGTVAPIDGYTDFAVLKIEAGHVAIQRPDDLPCVAYPGLGVSCTAVNVTALDLRIAGPDAATAIPRQPVFAGSADLSEVDAEPGSFIESLQDKAEARGEKPEVPAGLQLLETSSGYRLIPED